MHDHNVSYERYELEKLTKFETLTLSPWSLHFFSRRKLRH
jgi:hypothetical protein